MDAEQLRTLQAPLKQRYRDTPDAARVPARAEARLEPDTIAATVPSWRGETQAGLHPATGGSGDLACSADMLLEAVVACAGVTLRAVATAMGVSRPQRPGDRRGNLGRPRNAGHRPQRAGRPRPTSACASRSTATPTRRSSRA